MSKFDSYKSHLDLADSFFSFSSPGLRGAGCSAFSLLIVLVISQLLGLPAIQSSHADEFTEARSRYIQAKNRKAKNKKKKKKEGRATARIDSIQKQFIPKSDAHTVLRHKSVVSICNQDNFDAAPWTASEQIATDPNDYGNDIEDTITKGECKDFELLNPTDSPAIVEFFDNIHSQTNTAVCVLPKKLPKCFDVTGVENMGRGWSCSKKETCCSDGIDNDGDGDSDCEDPDCSGIGKCCTYKRIDAQFDFFNMTSTVDTSLCTAPVFVSWSDADDEKAESWTVHYKLGPTDREKVTMEPDFDDFTSFGNGLDFTVPGGRHWTLIVIGGKDTVDYVVADCSDLEANARSALSEPYVEIQICKDRKSKKKKKKNR